MPSRACAPPPRSGPLPYFLSLPPPHPPHPHTHSSSYPEPVWRRIEALFPQRKQAHPVAIDIAVGAEGRAGVELARR